MIDKERLSLICIVDEVDSTNEFLEKIAIDYKNKLTSPILFFSKVQKKGKGRGGKSFFSPKGGVYFSILYSDFSPPSELPLKTGLFFTKKLINTFNLPFKIRWPNDFIIDDKKFGGILIEVKGNSVIIGVGLNLEKDLSGQIKDQKTTYLNKYIKNKLKVQEFYNLIEEWVSSEFFEYIKKSIDLNLWKRLSYFKEGDLIEWEDGKKKHRGICRGILENGSLKAEINGEIINLVSVERIYRAAQ